MPDDLHASILTNAAGQADGRRTLWHMLPPIVNSDPGDETQGD